MSTTRDQEEQDWRIEHMIEDIVQKRVDAINKLAIEAANKSADTALKQEQRRWEPWKAMAVAGGAGATIALALVAVITALLHALVIR